MFFSSRIPRLPPLAQRFRLHLPHLPPRVRPALLVLGLLLLTEGVTPHISPAGPLRLTQIEARMGMTGEDLQGAFDALLEEYLAWHARVASTPAAWPSVRVLAWNGAGSAGLGDKIRGLHHALMLAMETGRFFVVEDVPDFPIRRLARAGRLAWDTPVPLDGARVLNWRTSWARGRAGVRRLSEPEFSRRHGAGRVVRLASAAYPMYERAVGTAHWRVACRRLRDARRRSERCGYLGAHNVRFNRRLHAALFRPRRAVRRRVADALARLPDAPFVAVHARLGGDFRRERKSRRFARFNDDLAGTADRLLRCVDPRMGPVYLATDDEAFKPVFRERARRAGAHVVLSSVRPRHSGTVALDEMQKTLSDALAEGIVLSRATTLVTTGSGLATFAAFRGNTTLLLLDECAPPTPKPGGLWAALQAFWAT